MLCGKSSKPGSKHFSNAVRLRWVWTIFSQDMLDLRLLTGPAQHTNNFSGKKVTAWPYGWARDTAIRSNLWPTEKRHHAFWSLAKPCIMTHFFSQLFMFSMNLPSCAKHPAPVLSAWKQRNASKSKITYVAIREDHLAWISLMFKIWLLITYLTISTDTMIAVCTDMSKAVHKSSSFSPVCWTLCCSLKKSCQSQVNDPHCNLRMPEPSRCLSPLDALALSMP